MVNNRGRITVLTVGEIFRNFHIVQHANKK